MKYFLKRFSPFIGFVGLCFIFWHALSWNPRTVPSALINKPIPKFSLPDLFSQAKKLSNETLQGKMALVNVWASWCTACTQDQPELLDIQASTHIPIYGFDYKDNRDNAKAWLARFGNPYQQIGFDQTGRVAINWGVYGTPETFLIDQHGVILAKQIGPMTKQIWQQQFLPLIKKHQEQKVDV